MPRGFRWRMGDYVGGDTAVHQSYKPWLAIESGDPGNPGALGQAVGEITIQARDTANIVVSGLGFTPDILFLASYRPRLHNNTTDRSFGTRGGGYTFGVAGPYRQFTGSSRMRNAFDTSVGLKRWREDCCFNVISHSGFGTSSVAYDILTLELVSLDADGFTLAQPLNLYDQTDNVAWLAMKGDFQVGVISVGDTSIGGFSGSTPSGAVFLSTKSLHDFDNAALWNSGTAYLTGQTVEWLGAIWEATTNHTGSEPPSADWTLVPSPAAPAGTNTGWDHLTGYAGSNHIQAGIWGGARPSSWNWTTEYWSDTQAMVLAKGANGSLFVGAELESLGKVLSWVDEGISIQWDYSNGEPWRIGYVLVGSPAEAGILETNWETRPGGTQNDPSGSGFNFEETSVRPYSIMMAGTNFNFSTSDSDPFNRPREPNEFGVGGSGGIGWHAFPYSLNDIDAYSLHTYANGVEESGHFANSGTQFLRRSIIAGNGANSNPPTPHQHTVNVIPVPRQPGLNWRYADRHLTSARLLHDE